MMGSTIEQVKKKNFLTVQVDMELIGKEWIAFVYLSLPYNLDYVLERTGRVASTAV